MSTATTTTRTATLDGQTYTVNEMQIDGTTLTHLVSKRGVWYMLQEEFDKPGKFYMTSSGSGLKKNRAGKTLYVHMIGDIIEAA